VVNPKFSRAEVFPRPLREQRLWVTRALRQETVGGVLLLIAAVTGLVWANSPWGDSYAELADKVVGIGSLQLPLHVWAADGLLAVFFFVAGLELKHELMLGSLSSPARAAVPVAAALGGMIVPALIYFTVNATSTDGATHGWGIPMATDIAFALAVLAVVGRNLPVALRASLLTLAVVDDLGAIIVIAIFYSHGFYLEWFIASIACFAVYALLQWKRVRTPLIYVPLALGTWVCVYESGIHATVAGVVLGLLTRVRLDPGESESPAERLEHLVRPISAGLCVPIFAFFSSGVDLRSTGLLEPLSSPVAIGVMLGLVVGKPVGIIGAAWLTARLTRAELNPSLAWRDVMTMGFLAGIGFTVSLLISELAFADSYPDYRSGTAAVLVASIVSAGLAAIAIRSRNRYYSEVYARESQDSNSDGIPDIDQETPPRPSH